MPVGTIFKIQLSEGQVVTATARWSSQDRLGLEFAVDREFATAAGYVLSVLKKLPHEGESFTDQGWCFEVVDMDGRKIDKLLVSCLET